MVTEVQNHYWYKIITHYTDALHEKFGFTPLTPLVQHHMSIYFQYLVNAARKSETHPAWHVPIVLEFSPLTNTFAVVPAEKDKLKLIP